MQQSLLDEFSLFWMQHHSPSLMFFTVCMRYIQKFVKLNWFLINLLKVKQLFCTNSYQFNELKFTSAISLRNSASWRWLKIVMKWRHWSICTWKGWRRTDASPVWWVYAIPISSVTRQVWRSGLQRREVQKQIWQGCFFWLRAKSWYCVQAGNLGLLYAFETVFRSRHHYDEDRFILFIFPNFSRRDRSWQKTKHTMQWSWIF